MIILGIFTIKNVDVVDHIVSSQCLQQSYVNFAQDETQKETPLLVCNLSKDENLSKW